MATYIHAIRIILQTSPSANSSIGLYSGGEIRLSEIDLTDYSPTQPYTAGLLPTDFCGDISESIDVEESGNIARVDGTTIKIINTIDVSGTQTQFDKILRDSDIQLSGSTVQIIRFEISSGSLTDANGTVLFRGILGDPTWDEMTFEIPAENAYYTRRANLTQYVDSTLSADVSSNTTGSVVPVTFGYHDYAKFVRVSDKLTYLSNITSFNYITSDPAPASFTTEKILPVIYEASEPIRSTVLMDSTVVHPDYWNVEYTDATDLFIAVVDGFNSGLIRRIIKSSMIFAIVDGGGTALTLTFDWFINKILSNDDNNVDAPRSWVRLFTSNRNYLADTFKCFGTVDQNGSFVDKNSDIYVYDSESNSFTKIGSYAYDLDSSNTDSNSIILNPQLCSGTIDDISAFNIIPAENVQLYNSTSLSKFNYSNYKKVFDGLFRYDKYDFSTASFTISEVSNMLDSEKSTSGVISLTDTSFNTDGNTARYAIAFDIDLPTIDDDLVFDECYLFLNFYSECRPRAFNYSPLRDNVQLKIFKRRFYGNATELNSDFSTIGNKYYDVWESPKTSGSIVDSTPDFYYTDSPIIDTQNENFFRDSIVTESIGSLTNRYEKITNYELFKIDGVSNADEYNSYSKITVLLFRDFQNGGNSTPANSLTDFVRIYSVGIGFKQTKSVKSDFYTKFKGRIFNDTWSSRKTATDLIESAPDIAEHVLRNQNFTDNSDTPLIDTTTFDDATLDELKTIPLRTQILDYNSAFTGSVVESIAKQHFLAFTQDPATGNEQVSLIIDRTTGTPSLTINLSKIIRGSIRPVEPIRTRYIYAEPYIRYNKNFASGGYDSIIRITNAHQSVYSDSYVSGISGERAEKLWNKAHVLWNAVKKIETPPATLTDHNWIYTLDGAYWYLDNWLSWMGAVDADAGYVFDPKRRVELSVPYEIGKDLKLMDWVLLQLPHQTNNEGLKARVERYSKSIVKGRESVELRLIIYGTTDEAVRIIQDIYTGTDIWQDIATEIDIVQDIPTI